MSYQALAAEIEAMRAERDRLKRALEEIADKCPMLEFVEIAQRALGEESGR